MKYARLFLRTLELVGPEARLGCLLALGNVALAAAQFAEPVLLGRIVDALAGAPAEPGAEALSWVALWPLIAAWLGLGLLIILCSAAVALHAGRLSHRRRQAALTGCFEHVLQLPIRNCDDARTDRLMAVMLAGTDALWGLWLAFFREHLAAFVSLLVLLPLMLLVNWRLALVVIGLAVVFAFLTALVMRKTKALQTEVESHYAELAARAADTLGNVALVQSYTRVDVEMEGLRTITARLLGAQMPVLTWWALASILNRTATIAAMLVLVPFGIWLLFGGLASVGDIVSFVLIATLVMGRLEQAVRFTNATSKDMPRLRQFFDVLDTTPAVHDRTDAFDPGRMRGLVEFNDVSFSYDGKRPAVADLTFTALPGQTIALVGVAGAGKTTALALLHRDFDPQSGVVTIDGMDIRSILLSALRGNIGVVLRDSFFNRSIAENLRVAKPDASEDDLRAVCERAQVMDVIEAQPEGFQRSAGEHGQLLSADARTRLSIARAFLKDPPILIIDEMMGESEMMAEVKVQAALGELMKGRTTFVIEHPLATVRRANVFLVFDDGRIVESGSFDELMQRGGKFAALANAQSMTTSKSAANTLPEPPATES